MENLSKLLLISIIMAFGCTRKPTINTEVEIIGYKLFTYDSTGKSFNDNCITLRMSSGYYATIDLKGNCKYIGYSDNETLPVFKQFMIDEKKLELLLQNIRKISKDTCIFNIFGVTEIIDIRFIYKSNGENKIITTHLHQDKNIYNEFYQYIQSCAKNSSYGLNIPKDVLKKRNNLIMQLSKNKLYNCYLKEPISISGKPYKVLIDTLYQ